MNSESDTRAAKEAAPLQRRFCAGDFSGAFADGAILFPLLVALAWQSGASAAVMLATTGIAYGVTGWLFRLPIPVQPLKALAITAIAVGASLAEIRLAAVACAIVFLVIALVNVNRLAQRVPAVIVHGIQSGLGVILVLKALDLVGLDTLPLAGVAAGVAAILLFTRWSGRPILGWVAVASLLWGLWQSMPASTVPAVAGEVRPWVLAMLVLPQIALTLTNSVLGTERTARAYFGDAAERVTPRRLLTSIGLGNLAVAAVGGLPFCHGSGGVTAHVRGGSRSEWSNAIIAGALIALALLLHFGGGGLPAYPATLQAVLLAVVGLFHLQLATPSWQSSETRPILLVMGGAALLAQDMLIVLLAGSALLALRHYWPRGTDRLWRSWPGRERGNRWQATGESS